jgi:signal recognition particle GTPase
MFDEREVDRTEAIIRSMTPEERRNPKIIDGSRRARIAYGSGVSVSAVNALLQRFEQAVEDDEAHDQPRRHGRRHGRRIRRIWRSRRLEERQERQEQARRAASPATR